MLSEAQESFVRDCEIAENPAGGAANTASQAQEREWGLQFARQLASTGVPLLEDGAVNASGNLHPLCYSRNTCSRSTRSATASAAPDADFAQSA